MAAGMMVNGQWTSERTNVDARGQFIRTPTTFRHRVTVDGASGFNAEPGRYHLYVALPCPWAQRTLIMRELQGLQAAISVSIVDPVMSDKGWRFNDVPGTMPDTVNDAHYLYEVYTTADPSYTGRVTVPVLWDKKTHTIVNNESREIMQMLATEFAQWARHPVDVYPHALRQQIEATIDAVYLPINAGVYRAGFATSQIAYEEAVTDLFLSLDHWETVLRKQRYLCGDQLTAADICLFPTLYRFDAVYYSHFKCNVRRIVDYPNLWNYLKDLYQCPAFSATCDLAATKHGYYTSMTDINPTGIVPVGPLLDFDTPHDRQRFNNGES
jgi:putative glutathione S-transferase